MNRDTILNALIAILLVLALVLTYVQPPEGNFDELPDGAEFAFVIHMDADNLDLEMYKAIFDGVLETGFNSFIVTWWITDDEDCIEYMQYLESKGLYVTLHTATAGDDLPEVTMQAYDLHEEFLGHRPMDLQAHAENLDAFAINEWRTAPSLDPDSKWYHADKVDELAPEILGTHTIHQCYELVECRDIRTVNSATNGRAVMKVKDYLMVERLYSGHAREIVDEMGDYYMASYTYAPKLPDLNKTLLDEDFRNDIIDNNRIIFLQTHGSFWLDEIDGNYTLKVEIKEALEHLVSEGIWNENGAVILKDIIAQYEDKDD
tara:strand:- start:1121 stop:2074 length:954 start_codon:yes stop_codon:yes gene_type:complete